MKLSELSVGAKISDDKKYLPWIVADQSGKAYPGTVLISDFLVEAGCYDAPEPESRFDEIRQFGWNRYPVSNVHQWLNSDALENWFEKQHPLDMPPGVVVPEPYQQKPGFLFGFSDAFMNALQCCNVTYAYQDDYYQFRHGEVECRVFLPSRTELGVEKRPKVQEGNVLELTAEPSFLECAPTKELVASHGLCDRDFHPSSAYPYWLRSVDLNMMHGVYFYGMSRAAYFLACQSACGIRPMVVLNPETPLESIADPYGVYLLKGEKS